MKDFSQITDVFFDLDHTIYDFEKNSELAFSKVFEEMDLKGTTYFMEKFKPINDFYWDKLAKNEITHDFLRVARLKDTFDAIDLKKSNDKITMIADDFINYLPNYNHVFEGAYETLDYLKTKYRLHIITNGPDKVQELKLKNSQLDQYFISVTNSEISGVKKPHPAIFNYALNVAEVQPAKSLMIGDNLDADIFGALNVGMEVIWFNEFSEEKRTDFTTINKLIELTEIL